MSTGKLLAVAAPVGSGARSPGVSRVPATGLDSFAASAFTVEEFTAVAFTADSSDGTPSECDASCTRFSLAGDLPRSPISDSRPGIVDGTGVGAETAECNPAYAGLPRPAHPGSTTVHPISRIASNCQRAWNPMYQFLPRSQTGGGLDLMAQRHLNLAGLQSHRPRYMRNFNEYDDFPASQCSVASSRTLNKRATSRIWEAQSLISYGELYSGNQMVLLTGLQPRTYNQEPRTYNLQPRTKNQEPRTKNQELKTY